MKKIKYIYDSIKWIQRKINKDDIFIFNNNDIYLFILFDWVSSSINAKKGINFIKKFIWKNINKYIINKQMNLKKLIFDSNNALLKNNIEDSFSTCSAFSYTIGSDKYNIINIGDSRVYWIFTNFKEQFTEDDNEDFNSNIITKALGMNLVFENIKEIKLETSKINNCNILICSDWFYNIFEKQKLLFHKTLHFKKLWNIKNRLKKEIYKKNLDDSSYIYILTNKDV